MKIWKVFSAEGSSYSVLSILEGRRSSLQISPYTVLPQRDARVLPSSLHLLIFSYHNFLQESVPSTPTCYLAPSDCLQQFALQIIVAEFRVLIARCGGPSNAQHTLDQPHSKGSSWYHLSKSISPRHTGLRRARRSTSECASSILLSLYWFIIFNNEPMESSTEKKI